MKAESAKFKGVVEAGHKGCAVEIAFDPARLWKVQPTQIVYQKVKGIPVAGRLNRVPFSSWIISRWGKRFVLISDDHLMSARVKPGDEVRIEVTPVR